MGSTSADAAQGSLNARNSVENNEFLFRERQLLVDELRNAPNEKHDEIIERHRRYGLEKAKADFASCQGKGDLCHLDAIERLRNINHQSNVFLTSLRVRNEIKAASLLTIQLNNIEIAWHTNQLSTLARVADTALQTVPALLGMGNAAFAARGKTSIQAGTAIDNKVRVINKARLNIGTAQTFKNGNYQTVMTNQNVLVYRKFGGGANQGKLLGAYATTQPNANRNDTAVYPKWSTYRFEAQIEIPQGQIINIGKVGAQPPNNPNPKYRGGADQILMPVGYPFSWVKLIRDGKTGRVYTPDEFRKFFFPIKLKESKFYYE